MGAEKTIGLINISENGGSKTPTVIFRYNKFQFIGVQKTNG